MALGRRYLRLVLVLELLPCPPYERQSTCNHLEQHDAKGIDVHPYINVPGIVELLGRHMGARASGHSRMGQANAQVLHHFVRTPTTPVGCFASSNTFARPKSVILSV
jgi:hypothetical protein